MKPYYRKVVIDIASNVVELREAEIGRAHV